MMLHLGVFVESYNGAEGVTTGDVAGYLEKKYGVMQHFADLHIDEIAEVMTIGVQEAIEALMQGAPARANVLEQPMTEIKLMFDNYLSNEEIVATGQSGVPTQAALMGIRTSLKKIKELKNKRTYRSKIRGSRRPSFIDTGDYRDSFHSWVE
jgi:hypothetical protein